MTLAVSSAGNVSGTLPKGTFFHSHRSSLFDPYSDNEEEELEYGDKEELEFGRGGRKESDDLMLQLDSIIPGVLEPLGIGLRTYYFRNIGNVFSSTSAPSASSITIKSPSIHSRHSLQVVLSYFVISNLKDM